MIPKPITDFDPTPYLTIPRLPAASLLTLGNVLLDLTPQGDWPDVTNAAKRVRAVLDEAEGLMVERIRDGGRFTREDVKFDGYTDGLWGLFRDRLLGWNRYLSDGRQRMRDDKELKSASGCPARPGQSVTCRKSRIAFIASSTSIRMP